MKIQITFGALAAPLHEQLGLPKSRVRFLQKAADAIVRLSINGFITDAETHRARRRLMKRIMETFGSELAVPKDADQR